MATTTSAQQILRRAGMDASGVPDHFWETLESYRAELEEQARAILGNSADAEDVVQETFCEALRNPQKLSEVRSVGAWLKTINRANALNRARDKRHDSK